MRIFLFGSNGMAGNYIKKYLSYQNKTVIGLTRNDVDLNQSYEKLNAFLHGILQVQSTDIIINAAGIIKQRNSSMNQMINVNSIFPQVLGDIKDSKGCNVIHISTDCVFSGRQGGYIESDLCDSIDDYGKTKSLGEHSSLTTIRTSLIGEERNYKKSLLEWVKTKHKVIIPGYENHFWNGITCIELAKVIDKIINDKLYWEGPTHIFSPRIITKYELVNMINNQYQLGNLVEPTLHDIRCDRSLQTKYNSIIQISPIEEQIAYQKKIGY